jgi:hypothetical protein
MNARVEEAPEDDDARLELANTRHLMAQLPLHGLGKPAAAGVAKDRSTRGRSRDPVHAAASRSEAR